MASCGMQAIRQQQARDEMPADVNNISRLPGWASRCEGTKARAIKGEEGRTAACMGARDPTGCAVGRNTSRQTLLGLAARRECPATYPRRRHGRIFEGDEPQGPARHLSNPGNKGEGRGGAGMVHLHSCTTEIQ